VGAAFYSGRRQTLVAIVFSTLLASIVMKGRRRLVAAGAIILLISGLYFLGPVRGFLEGRESLGDEIMEDGQAQYMPIHEAGALAFLDSPIAGIGLGNYASATAIMGVTGSAGAWATAHSSVIRVFAETGLLGGIGLMILTSGFAVTLFRVVVFLRISSALTPMHFILPSIGLVLTGYVVTILDAREYTFLFGQTVGLMSLYIRTRVNQISPLVHRLNIANADGRKRHLSRCDLAASLFRSQ